MGEISPDVVAAVLRRAAEIESAAPETGPLLDASVIADIGTDLGLSADAVARATAEWERGELAVPGQRLPHRVLGIDAIVRVDRQMGRDAGVVRADAERWLDGQVFERHRHSATSSEWAPRRGPVAKVRRATDLHRRLRLRDVDRVALTVTESAAGRASVRIEADLGSVRRGLLAMFVAAPLALGIGAGVAAAEVSQDLFDGPPVGVVVAGAGWVAARRGVDRRRVEVTTHVQAALDDVAAGTLPASPVTRVGDAVGDAVGSAVEAGNRAVREAVSRWNGRPGTREGGA